MGQDSPQQKKTVKLGVMAARQRRVLKVAVALGALGVA